MAQVTRTVEISDLTPEELANAFAAMDCDGQARFFNAVSAEASNWPEGSGGFAMQCDFIVLADELSPAGRAIMQALGEAAR